MNQEIVTIGTAAASVLAPFAPYLVEAGKKFSAKVGEKAWEQAEMLWKKIQGSGENPKIKGAAYMVSADPTNEETLKLLAKALAEKFEEDPQLAQEVKAMLGGEPGLQEVLASGGSWVEEIQQEMTGPGTQRVEASDNSTIRGVVQKKQ
jgi:hypothetical protein